MSRLCHLSLLFSCTVVAACSQSSSSGLEPSYEGCATDENWVTFDDYESTGRTTTSGLLLPVWLKPAMSGSLPAATAPQFSWQPASGITGMVDGDATCPQFQPAALRRGGRSPQHLAEVSGTIYDLQLAVAGQLVYRVLTTRQQTTVAQSTWSAWAGKSITATLYAAKMLQNEILQGPYQAAPLTLTVTP